MSKESWRDSVDLAVNLMIEAGLDWAREAGIVFQQLEAVRPLTEELGSDWMAIVARLERAGPRSCSEIARDLKLDPDRAARGIGRRVEHGLVEPAPLKGIYALRKATRHAEAAG